MRVIEIKSQISGAMMRNPKIYPSVLLLSVVFAAAVSSAPARAANVSVHFNGTLGKPVQGTCSSGYADRCFSGFCGTVEPTGTPKVTGTFGKGTVTAMCVTLD